ncbi:hypothetical protein [Nostoc sp. T09]|uniref:hypothetical protein n=1 Tax=Nostoc sp. T09 TaxID=1932621 RepID=UPI0015C4F03D|nr:hypothetical protein [Nostoc sp. T09]
MYVTGRSLKNSDSNDRASGSLNETKSAVEEVGDMCIPIQVDHTDDQQVSLLFERQLLQRGKLPTLLLRRR